MISNLETYNIQRYIQFGLFGLSLLLIIFSGFKPALNWRNLLDSRKKVVLSVVAVTAIVVGAIISTYRASQPVWSLLDLEYWLLILGMTWLVYMSFQHSTPKIWLSFGQLVVFSMFLYSLRSLLEVLISVPFSDRLTATPGFANIRSYADLAVVFIPFSWLALTPSSRAVTKLAVWLINVSWLWILVVTEARSGLLSLVIGVAWVAVRHGKCGRNVMFFFGLALFVSLCISFLAPVMSVGGWTRDITSSSGRWELWERSLMYFVDGFPFGIGGMMFAADGTVGVATPHNLILTVMAEWGGLVVLGITLVALLVRLRCLSETRAPQMPAGVRVPITVAALAAIVNVQFAASHSWPFSSIALILACGAYLSTRLMVSGPAAGRVGSGRIVIWVLVFVFLHASFLGYELHQFAEESRAGCVDITGGILFPRFWIQGRLDCGF